MNASISNSTLVKLKPGESLHLNRPVSSKPFYRVGNGTTNSVGKSMNLIQEMTRMSKPELFMFGLIEKKLSYVSEHSIGEVQILNKNLTSTEKQYIKKAYKLLRDKNIIVRTTKEHYLVNPSLIMPRNVSDAEVLWSDLTGETDRLLASVTESEEDF